MNPIPETKQIAELLQKAPKESFTLDTLREKVAEKIPTTTRDAIREALWTLYFQGIARQRSEGSRQLWSLAGEQKSQLARIKEDL